jgi:hypothetical protein
VAVRVRLGVVVAAVGLALTVTVAAGYDANAMAVASCSKATATRLVKQHRLNPFLLQKPVAQVLCGPFTGPGSKAMAVTILAPTCAPIQNWAVFSFRGGAWRLVLKRSEFVMPPLVAAGSDIRETVPVYRTGDNRCNPTGGTKTVTWHWNGSRFTATNSKQPQQLVTFLSADRKVWCIFSNLPQPNVSCGGPPPTAQTPPPQAHAATLTRSGALTICNASVCFQNWDASVPVLRIGQTSELYDLRCRSATNGITCTVTAGARKGKGFRINAAGVTRVEP